jgi:maltose-binding protein MalE
VDSFQRPELPRGVEPLATPYVAGKFGNSALIASVARANVDPSTHLVADFTPEYTNKVTAASYLGGTWQMASKATQYVDETVELIAFLVSPEHLLALSEATTTVPARKSLEKAPYLQDAVLRPFYESLQHGWSVPQHPRHREIETKLIEMMGEATQQTKSVQQALADAAAFANALLASR